MTAGPDYELAYALLADQRDEAPELPPVWHGALLELAARALGYDPRTGLKLGQGWLAPGPILTLDEVNGILSRVGIVPLAVTTLTPAQVRERLGQPPLDDLMATFFGATG